MKIAGLPIEPKAIEEVYIDRPTKPLQFKFKCVENEEDFDLLVKLPAPPKKTIKGGATIVDLENPVYLAGIQDYSSKKTAWLFLQSISATDNLEWETVKLDDISSWTNWEKELKDSGFNENEKMMLWDGFKKANGLSEKRIEEARARFLALAQPTEGT